MTFCTEGSSFKAGAFEGSLIGLSIGVVMGSLRALSLRGVRHDEDETPIKSLISHIVCGYIAGGMIGAVHVFFKNCVFKS